MDERESRANRMERQRGTWLRALLTVDPSMAELDFRRLVLEFPGGPYSDDALLRLAQLSFMRGDLREAHGHYSALERDYPGSPHGEEAARWIRDHQTAIQALGPSERTPGRELSETPIIQREPEAEARAGGEYSVQLGAFRSLSGARSLAVQLRDRGYEPRLVRLRDNDLIRVRVGRMDGRREADTLRGELMADGFEAAVVSDVRAEEEVG
jgi:hypothetical protein